MLIKEECEKALDKLRVFSLQNLNADLREVTKSNDMIEQLIKEHFEAKAYKFEELKEGMWVWDKRLNFCHKIFMTHEEDHTIEIVIVDKQIPYSKVITLGIFEENRFFPVQMANIKESED